MEFWPVIWHPLGPLDPFQFTFKRDSGTDDAVLILLNTVTKRNVHPKGYARVLFIDFSSTFNSMKTHILMKRLIDLSINTGLVFRIRNLLSCCLMCSL